MPGKSKRTYNLTELTVHRVRELAGRYGAAPTQDAVVELAVERLHRSVADEEEARRWAAASEEPEFQEEMRRVADDYDRADAWPE